MEEEDINPTAPNAKLANVLRQTQIYYTIEEDAGRTHAYAKAATEVANYPYAIVSGAQARRDIPGVGQSIATDIDEWLNTRSTSRLASLQAKFASREDVTKFFGTFFGIGPVKANRFYDEGYRTLNDLWFKARLTEAQRLGIYWRDHLGRPVKRSEITQIEEVIRGLIPEVEFEIAGSYRRGETESGDVDILVRGTNDLRLNDVVEALQSLIKGTLALGPAKYMGIIQLDDYHYAHRLDIRLIPDASWAYGLMYFTGSQRFNVLMRQRASDLGLTLNEYDLHNDDEVFQASSEEDIFDYLRVEYLRPDQRTRNLVGLVVHD